MQDPIASLKALDIFFKKGSTQDYAFRKSRLLALKAAIRANEQALHEALYADLKKSPEESWVTETGFVQATISHALRHLKQWMKPRRVATNLLNLPGRSFIQPEPLGVVLIIAPWNYPFQLLFSPLVGAIAAGNCVVLKPSEFAPATAAVMKKVIGQAFASDHVLYLEGDGAVLIPRLTDSFRFDHIFYTGSTAVGKLIYEMAAKKLVPVTLELGGKSPCVIESDANIRIAARRIALAKFSNAGQMCVAPDYILAHRRVKEDFIAELKKAILAFYSGKPSESYNYGKIINEKQMKRLVSYLSQGRIVHGGSFDIGAGYMEPTILEDVKPGLSIMEEEIFGPLLPVIGFDEFDEARSLIDRHPDPLAFYVFTGSREKERKWLEGVRFGGGCVNNVSWHLTNFNLPFGGRGNSGTGAYHGRFSFDVFSHKKGIMKTPVWFDPSIRYPPFKGKLELFKRLIR
ncbi:MAG TPA: aldehyde dehydrogenase [Flavisolibacter sp.]|nr:aldehyde dehydrogenase [Flavisolibacter sp.]